MKKCNKCLVEKEISEFPKTGNRCKSCQKEYRLRYKEENKEKIKKASKKYYNDNKEKILEYSKKHHSENKEHYKEYRLKNKEKIKENHDRYVEKNSNELKEYNKKWRKENKEHLDNYKSIYYVENKEKINESNRKYYHDNKEEINNKRLNYDKKYREENKEKIYFRNLKWRKNNPKYYNQYLKKRCEHDRLFYLTIRIRSIIKSSFRYKGFRKNSKTSQLLGCSFEDFKLHLESKFEDWMTWDNYGKYNGEFNYGWDIDHIIPLSSAETEEDVIKLNHYKNLKPLCSYLNRVIKSDKIIN
jgi:hypothetical protein